MNDQFDMFGRRWSPRAVFALALTVMLALTQVVPLTPALAVGPQAPNLLTPTRPAATPLPRKSPTPVATPTEAAPAFTCDQSPAEVPGDWPLGLCESFSDNANGWLTGQSDDDFGVINRQVQDGAYTWDLNVKNDVFWSARYTSQLFSDFYLSSAMQVLTGPDTTQYALEFRWVDSDNFYTFLINDQKQYRADLMYRGKWQTLIDWTDSEAIVPGEVNELAVKAEGRHFTFFINGEDVGELNDTRLKTGLIGVAAGLPDAGQASVSFDNVQVWVSPTGDNPTTTPTIEATNTPTARATPRVTPKASPTRRTTRPTATPTPSQEACAPDSGIAPADWSIVMCDTFVDDSNGWPVGDDNSQYADVTRTLDGGVYTWEINTKEGAYLSVRPDMQPLADFYLAVEAARASGPDNMNHGVQFRFEDASNYYTFSINDAVQEYTVQIRHAGAWETPVDWTHSEAIKPGEANRLAVLGEGSQFTFYINDEQVGDLTDDRLPKGLIGLRVDMDANEQATIDWTTVDVRAPAASGRNVLTPTVVASLDQYECIVCGYIYDPAVGDPDSNIPAGTAFADLPEDWTCPDCGVGKDLFDLI